MGTRTVISVSIAIAAAGAIVSSAAADAVFINSPLVQNLIVTGSAAEAKYRLSNSNFDMTLANGNGGGAAADRIATNLANSGALSGRTYQFSLEHRAGLGSGPNGGDRGFVFTMSDGVTTSTQSWGTFASPPGSTASLLNGQAPLGSFNSLSVVGQATRFTASAGSSMTWSNLQFVAAGLVVADGGWNSGSVSTPAGGPSSPAASQRLVADVDLSRFDWTFSGVVTGVRDAGGGGDETVRFTISAQNTSFTAIPSPGSGAVGMMAAAGLLVRRVSRR